MKPSLLPCATTSAERAETPRWPGAVALCAVLLLAVMQRAPVAGLGAVLPELHLPGFLAAALTSAPAVCIMIAALATPALDARWGSRRLLIGCAGVLAGALLGRVVAGPAALLAGSVLAYLAIAVTGVVLPAFVRSTFGRRAGTVTAAYAAAISAGVAAAGALTPRLETAVGAWQPVVAAQAIPVLIAGILWIRLGTVTEPNKRDHTGATVGDALPTRTEDSRPRRYRRSPRAWLLSTFFGLQSLLAVALLSYEPLLLQRAGTSADTAGGLVAVTMGTSILTATVLGSATNNARNQTAGLCLMTASGGAGLLGLWLAPTIAPWLWAVLLGGGVSVLSTALRLPVLRTDNHRDAVRLSSMTQSVGYGLAALGPTVLSLSTLATGLVFLLVCTAVQLALAVPVGQAGTIHRW